jgi:hypothetical protein
MKTCTSCKRLLGYDSFTWDIEDDRFGSDCKDCIQAEDDKKKPTYPALSAFDHGIVQSIMSAGYFAESNKLPKSTARGLQIFGCIHAIVKRASIVNNSYIFRFGKLDVNEPPDIYILSIYRNHGIQRWTDIYIAHANNPIFYKNGKHRSSLSYTPNSAHRLANNGVQDFMAEASNNWAVIQALLRQKIRSMQTSSDDTSMV